MESFVHFSDYDTNILGPFWSQVFEDQKLLRGLLKARSSIDQQTFIDLQTALLCKSRHKVPFAHEELHWPLVLEKNEAIQRRFSFPKYDENYSFNSSVPIWFDEPVERELIAWPIPENVLSIPCLVKGLESAEKIWVEGLDYVIKPGWIAFREDPFLGRSETTLRLWGRSVLLKKPYVYRFFGSVVDSEPLTGKSYRSAVNVVLNSWIQGSATGHLIELTAAMLNVPYALKDDETVESIETDHRGTWIITDQQAALIPSEPWAAVTVGQKLSKYQILSKAVAIVSSSSRSLPPSSELPYIVVGKELMDSSIKGPLTFENAPRPLTGFVDANGWTVAQFPITGSADDVNQFWTLVHQRGLSAGRTLACLLTNRPRVDQQPSPSELPTSVNPAKLIWEHWLRDHVELIHVRLPGLLPSLGVERLKKWCRKISPLTSGVMVQTADW